MAPQNDTTLSKTDVVILSRQAKNLFLFYGRFIMQRIFISYWVQSDYRLRIP